MPTLLSCLIAGQVNFAGQGWAPAPIGCTDALRIEIRPEHRMIAEGGALLDVENVDPTVSETTLQGKLDGLPVMMLLRTRANICTGDQLSVNAAPDIGHVFDHDQGLGISIN